MMQGFSPWGAGVVAARWPPELFLALGVGEDDGLRGQCSQQRWSPRRQWVAQAAVTRASRSPSRTPSPARTWRRSVGATGSRRSVGGIRGRAGSKVGRGQSYPFVRDAGCGHLGTDATSGRISCAAPLFSPVWHAIHLTSRVVRMLARRIEFGRARSAPLSCRAKPCAFRIVLVSRIPFLRTRVVECWCMWIVSHDIDLIG